MDDPKNGQVNPVTGLPFLAKGRQPADLVAGRRKLARRAVRELLDRLRLNPASVETRDLVRMAGIDGVDKASVGPVSVGAIVFRVGGASKDDTVADVGAGEELAEIEAEPSPFAQLAARYPTEMKESPVPFHPGPIYRPDGGA